MERLTRRSKVGEGLPQKHMNLMHMDTTSEDTLTEILDTLAEYEDTGLTPEDIEDFKNVLDVEGDGSSGESILRDLIELMYYRKTGLTPDEIQLDIRVFTNMWQEKIDAVKQERDYWEREAKKWADKLGDIKILAADSLCSD